MSLPKSAPKADNSAKIKMFAAIGCLAVAALLLAWNFNLLPGFGNSTPPAEVAAMAEEAAKPPETKAAEVKAKQVQDEQTRELEKRPGTVKAGA